jgi:hypothetical protein
MHSSGASVGVHAILSGSTSLPSHSVASACPLAPNTCTDEVYSNICYINRVREYGTAKAPTALTISSATVLCTELVKPVYAQVLLLESI